MLTCRNTHTHSAINSQKVIKIKLLCKLPMNGCKFTRVKICDLSIISSVVLFIGRGDAVQLFFREETGVVDVANQLGQQ